MLLFFYVRYLKLQKYTRTPENTFMQNVVRANKVILDMIYFS